MGRGVSDISVKTGGGNGEKGTGDWGGCNPKSNEAESNKCSPSRTEPERKAYRKAQR
jgi:hypothetical protein